MLKQGFIGEPEIELLPDGRKARLLADFSYVDKRGKMHTARKGLETDGVSSPRVAWRIVSPWEGKRRYAAILHDQLCADLRKRPRAERAALRLEADKLFEEMCLFLGESPAMARALYFSVRLGWYWEHYGVPMVGKTA